MTNDSYAIALLIGYRRVDLIQRRLEELCLNEQIPIFVSIDGGLSSAETKKFRDLLESDQWAKSFRNFSFNIGEDNLGLAKHVTSAIDKCLKLNSFVIVIEDDVNLSSHFISSMLEGFKLMNQNSDIYAIGGFSVYKEWMRFGLRNCWRKSKYFSAWGWGTSREVWRRYQLCLPSNYEMQLEESPIWQKLGKRKHSIWLGRFAKVSSQNPRTWDFQMQYLMFRNQGHMLLTTARISDNEGFNNSKSTHTTGERPKWMLQNGVSQQAPTMVFSSISKLYELGDAVTIGGDSRILATRRKIVNCLNSLAKGNT